MIDGVVLPLQQRHDIHWNLDIVLVFKVELEVVLE